MQNRTLEIDSFKLPFIASRVIIVGSGAASLNAAVHLKRLGVNDVTILTEKLRAGTSANAGSDKQTYYRLNPTGSEDCSLKMANDLFAGHCMHGDIAHIEAALSIREFYHLVELGVPFPQGRLGSYPGFQTDHDKAGRGTSAGPDTSILMVEKLLREAVKEGVSILDGFHVIDLLVDDSGDEDTVVGLIAVNSDNQPVVIKSDYIVYGTGGPGALYADSVYPYSQLGSLGIALKAGAKAQNLTESQFGIASTGFRWNLSGSYQQVIPRYLSTAAEGGDSREFLNDYFPSAEKLFEAQFLKGYQWPFDVGKLAGHGSSLIDLAVYIESKVKGRTVYLDFRRNPKYPGNEFTLEALPPVVRAYLEKSAATAKWPVERLKQMNLPAYSLYKENGMDLENRPIEIAVCHQHCNGGLIGSIWWESNLHNFFPVGECNGTHGLYRPGGSALNSGQVGSLRAAEMIHFRTGRETDSSAVFSTKVLGEIKNRLSDYESLIQKEKLLDISGERNLIQSRMSETLGIIRNGARIDKAILYNEEMQTRRRSFGIKNYGQLAPYLKNLDLLITERAFLESAKFLQQSLKTGRGSFLTGDLEDYFVRASDSKMMFHCDEQLPDLSLNDQVIQFQMDNRGNGTIKLEPVRPIPCEENWFEQVWKDYREGKHFQ